MPINKRYRAACLVAGVCLLFAEQTRAGDLAEKGHELVTRHCVRCHIVDEANRFTGISSSPSFKTLITALADWHYRFETFYARNPHPSIVRVEGTAPLTKNDPANRAVELSRSDIDAIVAYVERYSKELKNSK